MRVGRGCGEGGEGGVRVGRGWGEWDGCGGGERMW